MGVAGCGRDAEVVYSFAVVLTWEEKAAPGGRSEHCCGGNRAVKQWCVIANAIALVEKIGHHTHTHTHTVLKDAWGSRPFGQPRCRAGH